MPGCLVPGDLEAIKDYLNIKDGVEHTEWIYENFRASRGAKVLRKITGNPMPEVFEVPSLVPAQKPDGSCVFLSDNGECNIHPVAPFGCAYLDMHMGLEEADERSNATVMSQMAALVGLDDKSNMYRSAVLELAERDLIAPPLEERRANLEKDLKEVEVNQQWQTYDRRVQALEAEGLTRSDAQGVVDAEDLKEGK
jgi:Fe-S-cluster containining protein